MKKTSKKTIKRKDHKSISYRLQADELGPVEHDLGRENGTGRPAITLAAYAKHALLFHGPLNQIVVKLSGLRATLARADYDDDVVRRDWLLAQLDEILTTRIGR